MRRLGTAVVLACAAAAAHAATGLRVDGTEFVFEQTDGRELRSAQLVGATLKLEVDGQPIEILIEDVEDDPRAVGGKVVLHSLLIKHALDSSQPLCKPDAQGRNLAFPVPDGRGSFDLTCTSGAVGKCIRWGYRAWDERPGGPPLKALHHACVHMARADYGGDGSPNTRNGTLIDVQDRYGIQRFDGDASMAFEAAWGVEGAVCVARPRIADMTTLDELAERHPRLHAAVGADVCSEGSDDPRALLFNRSYR